MHFLVDKLFVSFYTIIILKLNQGGNTMTIKETLKEIIEDHENNPIHTDAFIMKAVDEYDKS